MKTKNESPQGMTGDERARVRNEISMIENSQNLRYLRNSHYHYYLELCLKVNELPK